MNRQEYIDEIKNDILDNYADEIREGLTRDELADRCWTDDSITGNGSGSYTFNSAQAKENITGAEDIIKELVDEYGIDAQTVAQRFLDEEWEYWDVSIRCYLLDEAISAALEEIE